MKKSLLVTVGIIIILIILGVWGYLLFFGAPKGTEDVFANLGIGAPSEIIPENNTPDEPPQPTNNTTPDIEKALRQLTTKPVAGFAFLESDSTKVRYVERGVGHVFEIDLETGEETRISATTIPLVTEAIFSPSGKSVALMAEVGYQRNLYAAVLDQNSDQTKFAELAGTTFDPEFENDTSLFVAINNDTGTEGYRFDLASESLKKMFSIPLKDVGVVWHNADTFVYPKASNKMQGSLYKVSSNQLLPITPAVYGFLGDTDSQQVIYSAIENDSYISYVKEVNSDEAFALPILYIPEKCTPLINAEESMWCASDVSGAYEADDVEDWYKGRINYRDYLWKVDLIDQSSTLYADIQTDSGRQIDVTGLQTDEFAERLLFKNKIDNTLWFYDSTLQ